MPFVAYAENEALGVDDTDHYSPLGWTPARPVRLQQLDDGSQAVTFFFGQEHLGVMRMYDDVTIYKYSSDIDDWTPPVIEEVSGDVNDDVASVRAVVDDNSGVHEVWLTYTEEQATGSGHWRSIPMQWTQGKVWTASEPITRPVRYLVQAVDVAGNVGVADNDGMYFRAPTLPGAIGLHCGGVGPLGEDYCACVWGVVRVDGHPVEGAQVTLSFDGGNLTDETDWKAMEDDPYYDLSGQELGVKVGDVFTLTVRYQGESVSQRVVARPDESGEQRFDLWLGRTSHLWLPLLRP